MPASPVPLAPGIVPDKQLSPLVSPTAPSPRRWKHAQVSRSDDNRLPHVPTAGTKHRCQRAIEYLFFYYFPFLLSPPLSIPIKKISDRLHPEEKKIICKNINYTILITLFYYISLDETDSRVIGGQHFYVLSVEIISHPSKQTLVPRGF